MASHQAPQKRKYSPSLDFPELAVARLELSGKGKLVYLRMEEYTTEVWFKVEIVHWVMDDPKAKENLLALHGTPVERSTDGLQPQEQQITTF